MPPRKSSLWLAIAFVLGCGVALASQPVLVITPAGYFYLETGEDGSPISVPVDRIVDLRGGSPGDPDTPAPEPDTPDIELTRLAKGWAESVDDPQGSQAMELVYLQIADAIKAGHLTIDTAPAALAAASDTVLATLGKADAWKPFRASAGDELTERRQRGKVDSAASMETFLRAVAMGLQLSADGSDAITLSETLQIVTATNKAIDGAKN
jgi:hypothetical protein